MKEEEEKKDEELYKNELTILAGNLQVFLSI